MSSILTNTSAMVALQTLKGVNSNLAKTQDEISTGKSVSSAKDNAAVWAISKVMESDKAGFSAIQDSLSLGESSVGVARNAAEKVTDLLTQMKEKIVSAQTANDADRATIQTDINSLIDQIDSAVSTSQVNGINLVDGNAGTVSFLSSLDRDATGGVTAKKIDVASQDLSRGAYAAKAAFTGSDGVSTNADTAGFQLDNATGTGTVVIDGAAGFAAGDSLSVTIGGKTASYTFSADDIASTTPADMAAVGLKNAIDKLGIAGLTVDYDSASPGELAFTNAGTSDLTVSTQFKNAGSGGLSGLSGIDVSTAAGASAALGNIEGLIKTASSAATAFGTAENRISSQSDFLSKLNDSIETSIGSMVDADMEEASARLTALQTQQQLAVQSLSIANQAPQSILSLFQ